MVCLNAECYRSPSQFPRLRLNSRPQGLLLHWQRYRPTALSRSLPLLKPPKPQFPSRSPKRSSSRNPISIARDIAFLPNSLPKAPSSNEMIFDFFADCFKEDSNGLMPEAFIYCPTRMEPQIALCICDEPYKIFVNNQLVKEQAPRPQAETIQTHTLSEDSHPRN